MRYLATLYFTLFVVFHGIDMQLIDICLEQQPCGSFPCTCFVIGQSLHYLCNCSSFVAYNQSCANINAVCNPTCLNGGYCEFTVNSRTHCVCPTGYIGKSCEYKVAQTRNNQLCEVNGICLNDGRCLKANNTLGFICECLTGFSGPTCETYVGNYCRNENPCGQFDCSYLELDDGKPVFFCDCIQYGYVSFNKSCEEPVCQSECLNNGKCQYKKNGVPGCLCQRNYRGPTCGEIDIVVQLNEPCHGDTCMNGGTCTKADNDLGYKCLCPLGYEGEQCEIVEDFCSSFKPCGSSPCLWNPTVSVFICECSKGVVLINQTCENKTHCTLSCQNGGKCVVDVDSKKQVCKCLSNYKGPLCQFYVLPSDPCVGPNNPCLNGATCTSGENFENGFNCNCTSGFSGSLCELVEPMPKGTTANNSEPDDKPVTATTTSSPTSQQEQTTTSSKPSSANSKCAININSCFLIWLVCLSFLSIYT